MLRLFAGRENIDKERFIYDNIAGETLVIVPDQYTLVAEERALECLGTDCLFDVEVLSMNRLGLRLLTEQGRESVAMLDKYGRFMLLTRLIREHIGDFDIFRRSAGKMTFTSMLSDFISEFKQQDCSLDEIEEMLAGADTDPLLKAKLSELEGVIRSYEAAIEGRYTDSEDYIAMYVAAIRDSQLVRGKSVWIYGYDSITPKFTNAMLELAGTAAGVNFIVNRSDFELDEQITSMLMKMGREHGIDVTCEEIGSSYAVPRSETVRRIERGLWNDNISAGEAEDNSLFIPSDLTMVSAANPYYEAESAASYIWHLIRDLGYRMKDIQVIANDEGTMQPIIRRVFEEYGLPVFMDSSRNITDTPAAAFIVNLLWFVVHRHASQYMFAMLKTGLTEYDPGDIEDLENYVREYHIRGSVWDRDLRYGEDAIGTERFTAVNELRADIMKRIGMLDGIAGAAKKQARHAPVNEPDGSVHVGSDGSVTNFVKEFKEYLTEIWQLDRAVEDMAAEEDELGLHDESQRTVQSYKKALELLDQIVEIMGDLPLDIAEFTDIYVQGLTDVEVGVIPPAVDGLSVGTMIRTRPRPVRAAVILGANEGTLPLSPSPEGLFSVDEKEYFRSRGFELGSLDDIKMNEENAAMYRMLSRPSEKLYISWSAADAEGGDLSPSPVVDSLMSLFPRIKSDGLIRKDIISAGWDAAELNMGDMQAIPPNEHEGIHAGDTICTPDESLRHLMERIKDRNRPNGPDPLREALLRWYDDNRRDELDMLLRAAADENVPEPLGRTTAKELFGRSDGSLVLSASSIGNYIDCPFRYYVDRGLRPREEREFAGDSRSIGDVYHECLMKVARRLIGDRELLRRIALSSADGSDGNTAPEGRADAPEHADGAREQSTDELERIIDEELDRISSGYRGGLFVSTGNEEYRMSRIREICAGAAMAMAVQLSQEAVIGADFEESFGRRGRFRPVRLEAGGETVYVEGKIDRCDILDVDGEERARIIDYKTGSDSLNIWKMRNGLKMQLMIYMISATGDYEPAGMFYFNIKDQMQSLNDGSVSKENTLMDRSPEDLFKLKGKYVDEPGVLDAMPASMLGGRDTGISREDYETVRRDVLHQIERTASGILDGRIDIRPLKDNGRLVCTSCGYKSICRRDREYVRNSAREIPPEPKE